MNPDEWIAAYSRAWQNNDPVGVTELFTSDAVDQSSPTGPAHIGSQAIAEYWHRATATQQQLQLPFATPIVAGVRVAVEWWATLRDSAWHPDGSSPDVTLPGCLILVGA